MKANISFSEEIVFFDFKPDSFDEDLFSNEIRLDSRSCFFQLPEQIDENSIHPDLLALSILLLSYPYISKYLDIPFSVSQQFSDLCQTNLNITIRHGRKVVTPRSVTDGRPSLAYSGGVDSTAALSLMPESTVIYFIDRVQPSYVPSLYNKFSAQAAVSDLAKIEKKCFSVKTNMEYMRSKIGFPVDSLNTDIPLPVLIPGLLLADVFNIDAVAFGVIMESVYMVGHEAYEDHVKTTYYNKWYPFFKLVSCDIFFPTAGITEVGTTIISEKTKFSNYVRSCMRGDRNSPCGKCIKCLRKTLLKKAVHSESAHMDVITKNLNSIEVMRNIYGHIYQHENIYRYIACKLPHNPFSLNLLKRISILNEDVTWMERWFANAIDLVPGKYRFEYIKTITKILDPMTETDMEFVTSWNVDVRGNKDHAAMKKWQEFLSKYVNSPKVIEYINKNH